MGPFGPLITAMITPFAADGSVDYSVEGVWEILTLPRGFGNVSAMSWYCLHMLSEQALATSHSVAI